MAEGVVIRRVVRNTLMYRFRHHYVELLCFVIELAVSGKSLILNQLLFKKICQQNHQSPVELCKSNSSINDEIQQIISRLTSVRMILDVFVGSIGPVAVVYVLLIRKTTSIIGLYIFGHTACVIVMMIYDSTEVFSNEAFVCTIGCCYLISFGSTLIVIFDYVCEKSSPTSRTFRFLLLSIVCKGGFILSNAFYGYLLQNFGFDITFETYLFILLAATLIFSTLEDFNVISRRSVKCWVSPRLQHTPRVIESSYIIAKTKVVDFFQKCSKQPPYLKKSLLFYMIFVIINSTVMKSRNNILSIYLFNKELMASPTIIGLYVGVRLVLSSFGASLLLALNYRFKLASDKWLIILVALLSACHEMLFGYCKTVRQIFSILPLDMGSDVIRILLSSKISIMFQGNDRVIFFGLDLFVFHLFGHLGTVLSFSIYSSTLEKFPGFIFEMMAALLVLEGIFAALFVNYSNKSGQPLSLNTFQFKNLSSHSDEN